jgi:hypothetical protein
MCRVAYLAFPVKQQAVQPLQEVITARDLAQLKFDCAGPTARCHEGWQWPGTRGTTALGSTRSIANSSTAVGCLLMLLEISHGQTPTTAIIQTHMPPAAPHSPPLTVWYVTQLLTLPLWHSA